MAAELRIAFVIPILGCGGAEVLLCAVMEELHKRNYSIICICLHPHHYSIQNLPNREFVLNELKPFVTNSSISSSFAKGLKSDITDYQRILEEFRPDIVHSHLYEAELLSRFYIYPGARYITHGHDNMPQFRKFDFKTLFNKRLLTNYLEYRWLCKRYIRTDNHFIAISKDVEQWFLTNLPSSLQKNVHLLPNGFNFNYYNQGSRIRKPENKIRLISIGNLVKKKNHQLLIQLAQILKKRNLDFSIDVYGYGILMESLKEEAIRLNVEKEIIFHGSVGNIHERLKKADVYVHPATYEPFGLVLLEAMANGLPVISLDGKGNRDLIKDGLNGYMIWKNEPELFAEKIIELVGSKTKMQSMSKAAIEFSKEYGIDGYVSKLLDIYTQSSLR